MKFAVSLAGLAAIALVFTGCEPVKDTPATSAKTEPHLGLQAWTFRSLSFADTLQKASDLGIKYLEAYPGQELGAGLTGKLHHSMDASTQQAVLKLAADKGITIVSYGVVNGKDEAEWRQIFDFAKALKLRNITSEPNPKALPLVAQLARDSGVKVALHNHPPPSTYADPAFAMEAVSAYGPEIGLCADTGHWARAGYDPVAVLRECMPRVIELHFKDLSERGVREARDLPWGTGTSDAAGQIIALRELGFDGVALAEYEHESPSLTDEVKRSAEFFRAALAAPIGDLVAGKVAPPGFTVDVPMEWADGRGSGSKRWQLPAPLLTPDLSNATFPAGAWTMEGGILKAKGGAGDIWTKDQYGDFVLALEFRVGENANSGVFIRCSDTVNWLHNAIEIQIRQGDEADPKHAVAAIFDCLAPKRVLPVAPGEWHKMIIKAQGSKINVRFDGEQVIDANLDDWKEPHKNPDGTPNKFEKAYKDMARSGYIGLQDHGNPIEFRNIVIEKIGPAPADKK